MKKLIPMNDDQKRIAAEIRKRCRTNPISRGQLAELLGLEDRAMREQIAVLSRYYRLPVGRSLRGYFWRRSVKDDEETYWMLRKKALTILRECSLLRRSMRSRAQGRLA